MSSGKPNFATYQNYMYGLKGFDELTTDTSGSWFMIKAISGSATISATMASGSNLTQVRVPESDIIYGWFTIVNIVTGKVLAYRQ